MQPDAYWEVYLHSQSMKHHIKTAVKRGGHEGRGCDRVWNYSEVGSTNSSYPKRSFIGGDFLYIHKTLVVLLVKYF